MPTIGDWLLATSATGGTGALTLANVSGWPNYSSMLGTTGTRFVEYTIREWTDSSHNTPTKFEKGIGSLALASGGGVLTRTVVERSYDGTTYKPNSTGAGASAISFGTNPANIVISCNLSVESYLPTFPGLAGSDNAGDYYIAGTVTNMDNNTGGGAASGNLLLFPIVIASRLPLISSVSIQVTTAATLSGASSGLFFGLYEYIGAQSGGPVGKLLADFGNGAAISTLATTGTKTGTLTTPIPNPGPCIGALLLTYTNAGDDPQVLAADILHFFDINFGGGASGVLKSLSSGSGHPYSALPSDLTNNTSGSLTHVVPMAIFA